MAGSYNYLLYAKYSIALVESHRLERGINMINLFSGTPGSGKSYHMARFIYNNIKYRDCLIIANFPVNLSGIKRKKGTFLCIL